MSERWFMNGWLKLVSLSDGQSTVVGWSDGNSANSAKVFAHGEMIMCNRFTVAKPFHNHRCKRVRLRWFLSGTRVSGKPSNGVQGHFPLSDGEGPPEAKEIMMKIILARRSLT
jgi:hypothetical protein